MQITSKQSTKSAIRTNKEIPMKKSKPATAEIVPYTPQDQAAELKRMVDRMVEEKLAAATTGGDAVFQPFFQPYEISNAISRTQTVTEQQKWTYYFEKWGCLVCQCKDNRYGALGMCGPCHMRVASRL